MLTSDEIFTTVTQVLERSLGVDEADIKPSATLQGDLGAESIDFLDIMFRLEREFGIKIPRGELFSELIVQRASEIVQNGRVTEAGLAALREQMPFADLSDLEHGRHLNQINEVFTVGLLTSYITWKLSGSGAPDGDTHRLSAHHSPTDRMSSVVSSGS
jgi:acyl carrier protein